jgi:hypothetical protein
VSDNWLQFVPSNPYFLPTPESAEQARALLATYVPMANEVNASFKDSVQFFHPGGNWSGVECPACGADAEPWWPQAMDRAWQNQFADLFVDAGCCVARVSLNELKYRWPAAFGRFVLETRNPCIRDLEAAQEIRLAEAIGHPLRKVWVHL